MEDQISQQPDEILVHILSLLTIEEAGRTSVLSRSWKDLWKLTTTIVFEYPDSLWEAIAYFRDERRKHLLPLERSEFLTRVNRVLTLHECPSLDKFSLHFSLDRSFTHQIDEWIKLIIQKRVKVIKIDLFMSSTHHKLGKHYRLSQECFKSVSSIQCLTSISLTYVNVDGELLEYLLSNCPHLEKLSVAESQKPLKLKVAGASVLLKSLKIASCDLESIELSAPKLVTFNYSGWTLPDFKVGSNPLFTELIVEGAYNLDVTGSFLPPFSSHIPQLETLSLSMWFPKSEQTIRQIPVLRNLNHLILKIQISSNDISLIRFTKLIMAAPCLVKFTLKLSSYDHKPPDSDMGREPWSQPHECLREVKIKGFVGGRCDFELTKFLLRNAINLEELVIRQSHTYGHKDGEGTRLQRQVDVLESLLPSGARLTIQK